jgi:hypothetical protein
VGRPAEATEKRTPSGSRKKNQRLPASSERRLTVAPIPITRWRQARSSPGAQRQATWWTVPAPWKGRFDGGASQA